MDGGEENEGGQLRGGKGDQKTKKKRRALMLSHKEKALHRWSASALKHSKGREGSRVSQVG